MQDLGFGTTRTINTQKDLPGSNRKYTRGGL